MTSALSIRQLTKTYANGFQALKGIDLEVEEGDFFALLGPNGAGKSTTIHCITGIAEPTAGSIEIFGLDAVKDYREARRLVGLCPQEFNVDPFANPRQIVDWMGGYFGMPARLRKERMDALLGVSVPFDDALASFGLDSVAPRTQKPRLSLRASRMSRMQPSTTTPAPPRPAR